MKKKAVVSETTVLVIILLLTTVLLGRILIVTVLSSGEESERLSCRISAIISSWGRTGIEGIINPFELYCPRQVIVVDDKQMTKQLQHIVPQLAGKTRPYAFSSMEGQQRDESPKTIDKIDWKSDEQVSQVESLIAYEMAECWKTFNEGTVQVIRGNQIWDHDTCFICSEIVFAETAGESFDMDIETYLSSTQTPLPGERQHTLQDFLYTSRDMPNSVRCDEEFKAAYNEDGQEEQAIPLSVQEGGGVLVMLYKHEITGIAESCLSVQYINSNEFPSMCEILIN